MGMRRRLAAAACRIAGRNLTEAEWDEHVGRLAPYRELCPDVARAGPA